MVGKGVDALGTVVTWLQGRDGFKDVLALVEDGIKLIRNFGSVIVHSTPHLYASALPFIPPNSLLSMMLLPKFPRLARVAVGGLKGWPVEQQLLQGHTDGVLSVAFSPDGKRIVSGSWDKTVRVWDVEGGVQIGSPLEGHTSEVNSVAFSPDGKRIVSGSMDNTVRVWDVEGGVQIGSPLEGHTDLVRSVAFSPDGKRIVSGSMDNTVRVWDVEGGVQIGSPLEGHTDVVRSVAFSPDEKRIASGSGDNTVRVWENEMFTMVASHPSSIFHPFPSADGVKGYSICFSFDLSHALYNSTPLVDGSMQQKANLSEAVKLHGDGWIKGPKGQLLLWIPPTVRRPFYTVGTTAVFPRGCCIELDLHQMVHGKEWCQCFHITG
ncbi:hypothetical protein M404DRAFT_1003535 [Pisolithus tinctorius Marx 270]|uniref:Uncharacterized protein n=1 Tax=Pisolithus tinctorius Marx 270 TaxID=870435 RepID=A0A0C3IVJ9_PISTI|nr:hypothetical protein M404DRAFT_1003535 [Pisolithus tinctorius Marx 270]